MSALYIRFEDAAAKFLLAVIVLLVFLAAIARSVGHPAIWSVDLAQLLFIWLAFLGANRAMRLKAHVGVDYFVKKLPHAARWAIELALGIAVLAFLVTLMWHGYKLTVLNWEREFGDSGIPYAFVTSAVPIGSGLLAVTILVHVINAARAGILVFYADKSIDRSDSQLG